MATREYVEIMVPEKQDSMSLVTLSGAAYYIRFQYIHTKDRWYFGLYDALHQEPIVSGIKIVPNFPLNLFKSAPDLPNGLFICRTNEDKVARYDFKEGRAHFLYMEVGDSD